MRLRSRFTAYAVVVLAVFVPWLAWETDRNMVRRWLYPVNGYLASFSTRCDAAAPRWLRELARGLPTRIDSPANQLVLVDRAGALTGCVNGWEHHPFLSERVKPETRFRLASLSKIVTFFGVLHARPNGQADWLDQSLASLLALPAPLLDERVAHMRVRHLLNHSAGFDRLRVADPMVIDDRQPWCPGHPEQLAKTKLQFEPGARYAYANLGYCLAAVAYERHSGRSLWSALEQDMNMSSYGLGFLDQRDSPLTYNFMHHERRDADFVKHFDWHALRAPMGMTGNAHGLARFIADHRSLLEVARGMHDSSVRCDETVPESCQDGFLERRRVGDHRVWVQRGYLYGMAALFLTDDAGNFIVWLGAGDLRQPLRAYAFVEQAFLKALH